MADDATSTGTHQNIARATAALDALARSGNDGLRLTDVANLTGMSKTTAHRCLAGLLAHGLATFDSRSNLFFLGDRILAWVGTAHERFALAERVKPYLRRLADELDDTIYFSARRDDDSVCYGRAVGSFPIKTLTLEVGDHRPLGVGSGSMAILAFLPQPEIDRVLRDHAKERARYPITPQELLDKITETREQGYSHMAGYLVQGIKGMGGIGVPIRDKDGACVASLSLAAITERLPESRVPALVTRLTSEATIVEAELAELLASL